MGKLLWHVGSAWSVEDDNLYNLGEFATRDEAVAAGNRDTEAGGHFYIIEAELQDCDPEDFDPDYGLPFAGIATPQQRIDVPAQENPNG